jgi:hypothetical protein
MRNRILLTTIVVLFSLTVSRAQFLRGYGLKLGPVSSAETWTVQAVGTSQWSATNRWGFTASAFVELFDLPVLSQVTEVQYTQRSTKIVYTKSFGSPDDAFGIFSPRLDYLSIP